MFSNSFVLKQTIYTTNRMLRTFITTAHVRKKAPRYKVQNTREIITAKNKFSLTHVPL